MSEIVENGAAAPVAWHSHPGVRIGLWAIGGGVVGYGVGWAIAEYEDRVPALAAVTGWLKAQTGWELAAGLTVMIMVMLGLWMILLSAADDHRLRRLLKMQEDDNPGRMRRMLPVGGWGLLLYAAIIAIFLIPGVPAVAGILVVTLCFAAVTWLFWRGWQLSDELERAAQAEAIIATFLIVEALGIGWAVLHHYALAPAIEPVAMVTMLTVIYYAAAMIAGLRRGLGQ